MLPACCGVFCDLLAAAFGIVARDPRLRSIEAAIDEMSEIDPWRFYGDARRIRQAADRLSAYATTIERMHEARAMLQAAE